MFSQLIFSLLLAAALIQPMAGGDQMSQVSQEGPDFAKEIEELYKKEEPGSPFNYEQGLKLIKRLTQALKKQIASIPIQTLAKLYQVNDSFYNRELKKLSKKLTQEIQKELAIQRPAGLPRGHLLHKKQVLMGDFLPRANVPSHYQRKKIFKKPFILFNDPFWEDVPTITQNKNFHKGEDLLTTSDHGFKDETDNPIPIDKRVGYNLYIPQEEPKALVIQFYGGATKEHGKDAAFPLNPNYAVNSFFLSNGIAVAELNLDDLRENPDNQNYMKKGMLNQVLNGALTFLETITQNPQSLSKDPKAQQMLQKLRGRRIFLYGASFGGRMVLEALQACEKATNVKLAGVISHDGSLYKLNEAPKSRVPVLILQNANDGTAVSLNVATDYKKNYQGLNI